MNYYYIEPIAYEGYEKLEEEELNYINTEIFSNFNLVFNYWPLDNFFDNSFAIIVDERLYAILSYNKISGIKFKKIPKVFKGPNFTIYPEDVILPNYREVEIIGIPLIDDFGYYKLPISDGYFREYLVASENAVKLLVLNNCIELRGELIGQDLDKYFTERRKKDINSGTDNMPRFEQKQFSKSL